MSGADRDDHEASRAHGQDDDPGAGHHAGNGKAASDDGFNVGHPLNGLAERTRTDKGAPFETEALVAIWELKEGDFPRFQRFRDQLKQAGCNIRDLNAKLKEVERSQRSQRGKPDRPAGRKNGHGQAETEIGDPLSVSLNELLANVEHEGGRVEKVLADLFCERAAGRLRYNHSRGRWLLWEGGRWRLDARVRVTDLMGGMLDVITAHRGQNIREEFLAARTILAVEKLARSNPTVATTQEDWDRHNDLLGTPGGIIDLRTGEMLAADPERMITRLTAVTPDFESDCPRWKEFLEDATGGDKALLEWLHLWFGYCCTGHVNEEQLAFFFGEGGNGKGTCLGTIERLLGDYAQTASSKVFLQSGAREHTTSIAALAGSRLVLAQETGEGEKWNEERVKALTGGDRITARFMRQDDFTFDPTFKLTFSGNNQPQLDNVDEAIKRRFNMVPFTHKPAVVDIKLKKSLVEQEGAAILAWAIRGAMLWYEKGLPRKPDSVEVATQTYFNDQDKVRRWIEEDCAQNPGLEDASAVLHRAYQNYTGDRNMSKRKLTLNLKSLGFEYVKRNDFRGFKGIKASNQHDPKAGFVHSKHDWAA